MDMYQIEQMNQLRQRETMHTLVGVEYPDAMEELMPIICNQNLDIRIESDPEGVLLIGDLDHIEYLLEQINEF